MAKRRGYIPKEDIAPAAAAETATETPAAETPAAGELFPSDKSGSEMVREALAEGVTKPSEIISWVKAKYGKEVSSGLIGAVKSKMGSSGTPAAGKKGKAPAASGSSSSPIGSLKTLIAQLGRETVKDLVDHL